MESQQPPGDTIFGGQDNTHNVTLSGDVVVNPSRRPPPLEIAVPCRRCGAQNWPGARWCDGCGLDFEARRRAAYRIAKLVLLGAGVALLAILAAQT